LSFRRDLRKLDGFGRAPPHSIRFLWYGGCKRPTLTIRTAEQPKAAIAAWSSCALLPCGLGETVAKVFEQGFQFAAEVDGIRLGVL